MNCDPIKLTERRSSPRQIEPAVETVVASFWQEVDQLASQQGSDISIPLLVGLLFPVRQDTAMDRIEFETRLRRGMAISVLIWHVSLDVLKRLYHPESAERVRAALPTGKPVVFLGNHIASVAALRFFKQLLFQNSQHLNQRGIANRGVTTSLVRLLRSVQSGQHVIISPDGARGDSLAQIKILGFSAEIGKGAAVLAHAAKCPVVAMHAVVEDNQFVPEVVVGPTPFEGEGLEPFVARVVSFYEERLNVLVKSDPINIGNPARILGAFRRSVPTMDPYILKYSIELCQEALRQGDDTYITYQLLSDLYRRVGDMESAIRYSKQAISVATNERDKIAQTINLASLLRLVKRPDEGFDLLNLSIDEFPASARLHFAKSRVLTGLMRHQQAIEAAEAALILDPANPLICRHLAVLYTRIGDAEKAADYEKRADPAQAGDQNNVAAAKN